LFSFIGLPHADDLMTIIAKRCAVKHSISSNHIEPSSIQSRLSLRRVEFDLQDLLLLH